MKILRKINKGFVLTIIVLTVLVVYLVSVEVKRNSQKPEIEKAAEEYIELIDKYATLPSEYQNLHNSEINKEEVENINQQAEKAISENVAKLKEELKGKMIDNETAIDMQKDVIEKFLYDQNDFLQSITIKFDREITKIKKYTFDDDQVTITFDSKIEMETKYLKDGEERINKNEYEATEESITLQIIDGVWKIVYADLQYYDINEDSIVITNIY